MKKLITQQIKFLKKIRHEYINEPTDMPKHVADDLADMGVNILTSEAVDFDKHYINQIDNQINLLKSKLNFIIKSTVRAFNSHGKIVELPERHIMVGAIDKFHGKRAIRLSTRDSFYWDINPKHVKNFLHLIK